MEQLGLDGMPRRLYTCTPSRLNTWLDCRRRYRFTYLDRPAPQKGPPWAHNSVGASVHNALASWWREPYDRRTPVMAAVLLTNGWIREGFRDEEQSATWRDRAREMVSSYVATLDPGDEPVGVERTVATRTSVIAVSGRVDRLDRRGDELVVVDYKTGRRPPTSDDARSSIALAVYAIASSRMMRRACHRVELHHLPSGTVAEWEHTDESLARHLRRAEDIATEAADADDAYRGWAGNAGAGRAKGAVPAPRREDGAGALAVPPEIDRLFPPEPGPICSWCDFRRHCPEGRAASPDRLPWDGLAETPGSSGLSPAQGRDGGEDRPAP
ncbi:PD-(D/E)XK nuclease family protein [Microbispora sp. NEAU-D428]|uniref:RecB family exonuclease n=1 Tax=Microbispora sitophila TaxID=2771537 RepID=UPI001867CCF6|nr:PD-(D/E)XK nuclease family protein [Microbispora sitophila]MBE3011401.1 PD-(D/E)XK nuclease family protein [Microbispora sitophila]